MKLGTLFIPVAWALAGMAQAATPANAVLMDFSAASLIEPAASKEVLAEAVPAKVWRLYPASKWAFVSQVEGGITGAGVCVVTARVMLVPLTQTLKAPLFRPQKIATAFDAVSGATADQCRQTARAKLSEAAQSVVSSLVKT